MRHKRLRQTAALGAATLLLALLVAAGSTAARGASRSILGTYQVVTRYTRGLDEGTTVRGTFRFTRFSRASGAFTGTGTSEFGVSYEVTGVVKGSTIVMRVVGGGGTAHDRGTIKADGSASGTFRAGFDGSGRWTMTRLWVVVEKTGWGRDSVGPYSDQFGVAVKLANRSRQDAYGLTVSLGWSGGSGTSSPFSEELKIAAIPAGQSFVVGDDHGDLGSTQLTRVSASVHVGSMLRHSKYGAQLLPRVSDVRIDRRNHVVTAVLTNTSKQLWMNLSYGNAYAALFNARGRIIGGGSAGGLGCSTGTTKLQPGGHKKVSIQVDGPMARVFRAQVSATP